MCFEQREKRCEVQTITEVGFAVNVPHAIKRSRKKSVKAGLRFEALAQLHIEKHFPVQGDWYHSKWIEYRVEGENFKRHGQPDSFLVTPTHTYIFEMKLRHTPRSLSQLTLYRELVGKLFPNRTIIMVELYRYWDWLPYPHPNERVKLDEVPTVDEGTVALTCLPLEL